MAPPLLPGSRVRVAPTFSFPAISITGYYQTVLELDEIVTEILIPEQPAHSGTAFLKFLPATQDDYSTISVAARIALDGNGTVAEARVALGAAGMIPVRARAVEVALSGKAANASIFREASGCLDTLDREEQAARPYH